MSRRSAIHVSRSSAGGWKARPAGSTRSILVKPTQAAAEKAAKNYARSHGGAEVVTHGRDGKIRSSDTIGRRDPNPPKDREH